MSDSADRTLEGPEKASDGLSHLIGSKDEEVRFLPDLSKTSHTDCPHCGSSQSWESDHCTVCGAGQVGKSDSQPHDHSSLQEAIDRVSRGEGQDGCPLCERAKEALGGHGFDKDARRNFSEREKYALIEEDGSASNAHKVDVKGSHYENQTADEIAMMILPLKGL